MNMSNFTYGTNQLCLEILLKNLPHTDVTYFDVFLIIPSGLFLIFLLFYCRTIYRNHLSIGSSIITTFYILLFLASSAKFLRAFVSILSSHTHWTEILDKCLWLVMRFFLLSTEMSIITFGMAAAQLDNRASVRCVLLVTSCISLTYTVVQATLEFVRPDSRFHVSKSNYTLYGHGGSLFFFISSFCFVLVYTIIIILPYTRISQIYRLPTKRGFYVYCWILVILYFVECISSILFYFDYIYAFCVLDITTYLYFAFYDPLVYITFLYPYFKRRRMVTFRYNEQVEYPDHSVEGYKNFIDESSSATGSVRHSNPGSCTGLQDNSTINDADVKLNNELQDPTLDFVSPQHIQASQQYYPDRCLVVDPNPAGDHDIRTNVDELMHEFNILPAGAQLDYASRYPTTSMGSDVTAAESEERAKSEIVSLCDEDDDGRFQTTN